jgi:hypothetical protein
MMLRANKQSLTLAYLIVPSARRQAEAMDAPLIRINPAAAEVREAADIGLAMGALGGLRLKQKTYQTSNLQQSTLG